MDKPISIDKIDDCFIKLKKGEIYHSVVGDLEKVLVEKALEKAFGNQILAAKLLGLNRNTMRTKIRKFNINVDKYKI